MAFQGQRLSMLGHEKPSDVQKGLVEVLAREATHFLPHFREFPLQNPSSWDCLRIYLPLHAGPPWPK